MKKQMKKSAGALIGALIFLWMIMAPAISQLKVTSPASAATICATIVNHAEQSHKLFDKLESYMGNNLSADNYKYLCAYYNSACDSIDDAKETFDEECPLSKSSVSACGKDSTIVNSCATLSVTNNM